MENTNSLVGLFCCESPIIDRGQKVTTDLCCGCWRKIAESTLSGLTSF